MTISLTKLEADVVISLIETALAAWDDDGDNGHRIEAAQRVSDKLRKPKRQISNLEKYLRRGRKGKPS